MEALSCCLSPPWALEAAEEVFEEVLVELKAVLKTEIQEQAN